VAGDGGPAVAWDAAPELPEQALGLADLVGFSPRDRSAATAYENALQADHRGDWQGAELACRRALAIEPAHLGAAFELARALAKGGKVAEVLPPLQLAVAGDFAKYGKASLGDSALAEFMTSPAGEAWRRRVVRDGARYVDAIRRAVIVIAAGDLYAYGPDAHRWYRLTHEGLAIAALRAPHAAGATLTVVRRMRPPKPTVYSVTLVDLATGEAFPSNVSVRGPIHVAWSKDRHHFVVSTSAAPASEGTSLEVRGRRGKLLNRQLGAGTKADWDDHGLASSMRLASSGRIASVPSPGLIDGHTVTWSHDQSHLAFVAQLDDHCAPDAINTAVYVTDAGTGTLLELERGKRGMAVEWIDDGHLAIAGDRGVAIFDLAAPTQPHVLEGADELVTPRVRPRCAPEPVDDDAAEPGNSGPR
jgi:hypothetical protein